MATIEQLRSIFGGGSDAVTIQRASQKLGIPIEDIASEVGFDTGGKWGNRASAGIDSAQASLLGVGEALTGSATLRNMREANNAEANAARQIARSKGAIMDSSQVEGFGTGLEFIGGLAVDTAPQLAATGLAGLAAGPWGAGTVGYTFALGDILENQREQAGTTDLRSAALLAAPYAAVDTFTGIGGAVTRRALPKAGLNLLDKTLDGVQGIKGAALRTGVNVGKTSVIEGAGETFQEGMNQLGRMAVDPNETFLNDRSAEAFKESFIGGAALGGAFGSVGGWRRSDSYRPPAAPIDENGGVNLLNGQPLNPPAPVVNPGANAPLADVINQRVGLDLGRKPVKGYESAFEAAATEPSGVRAVDPATGQEYELTQAEYLEREAARRNDAFAQQLAAEQAALAEDKAKIEARNAVREEAKGLGITGSKGTDLYLELKQALEDGVISEADFRETRVQLGERKNNQVAKFIKAAYAQADATQTAKAQMEADAIAAVQNTTPEARSISDQEADAMAAEWEAAFAEQAALAAQQGDVTDVQAREVQPVAGAQTPARRNWSDAPGAVAGIAPDKTVEVGRSGRKKALTPAQVLEKIKKASPLNKMRILAATGMDMVADPTTGAPKLVISGNPMTLDEIADAESEATGKKVSKQAISQALADAGIDADVATRVASTGSGTVYTEADLGITPTDEGVADASGFRIEDTASKAANQGLIYDEVTGNAELTKVANALLQGKMTPEAAAQAVEGKTSKTTAARDVKPENAVATAVEMPTTDTTKSDTVVTDLRENNDPTIQANIRAILASDEAVPAAADWGSTTVPWDTLPDTLKADWVEEYADIVAQFDGDLNQAAYRLLDAIQANIEDRYSDYVKNKGAQESAPAVPGVPARPQEVARLPEPANEARPTAAPERVGGPAAEPVENTSAEDQRVAQENVAKAKVVVKKKRTIQKPVAPAPDLAADDVTMTVREAAHKDERPGDILLQTYEPSFISLDQAVAFAKQFMDPADWDKPFQFNRVLDIAPRDWGRMVEAMAASQRFSKAGPVSTKTGNTVSQVKDAVNALFPDRVRDRAYEDRVKVHQSEADAVAAVGGKISADEMVGAQGFVDPTDDRIIHLVADNLPKGRELGVLLHEVGVHVGMTKKFKGAFKVLADQVQSWADAPRGSLERRVYEAAKARVDSANPDAAERSEELVAYAVEEAVSEGVMPNARGVNERVAKWLQNALSYMRNMVRDFLGFQPSAALTPQDLVDFAYGAARDTLGTVVVERAAMQGEPVTDKQLLQYYAKGEDIYDSAQILHHVGPGQEFIDWGPESTYGPHQGVTTAGYIYAQAAGFNPEADSGIQELEEVIPHPDTGIQVFAMMLTSDAVQRRAFETGLSHMPGEQTLATLEAWYVGAGNWSVVVRGPDPDSLLYKHLESLGQVKMSEPDMYGDRWSTLTGIENGDTQELLSEFRRRLTRALGGEVPGVMFTRATGAAVGKEGEYSPATVRRRFSKAAPSVAQQLGHQYAKAESVIKQAVGDLKTAAVKYGAFTRDLIDQAAKYMPAARQYLANYEAVATDRTRMEQKVDAILERFGALSTHERTRVNELIRSSTMSKEWAFKPDWLPNAKYDENSALATQFRAMTPAQRSVVQDVFRHGHETLTAMKKAVEDNVNSEFDVLIKGFKDAGNDAEAAKAEARKAQALQEFSSMLEMNGNWPYAPLRRFGDHVVVAKSAAYRAAEKAKDAAAIKKLEADENHYYVEFFESRGEARKKVADMQASGKYAGGVVENFNKGEANDQLYGGRDTFNAFRRLRNLVNETGGASLTEPANATINSLMNDLYLSLLGERSARQAERNRKNTAGADRDMMRAFATKGRADAHFIASLRFGGQVQEDLLKMKDQADNSEVGTRELRREFFNEILARHTMQMDFQSTPVVDKVMSFSSFFQLLVNPAYYLQNVVQPWVMSMPMLAGKHGYSKSWGALSKAYRDLLPLLKDGNFSKGDYDALPRDVQTIVKELAARGRIEISLEHDLGRWRSNADDGVATRYFVAAREKLRKANTQIEMVNRLATAIAAARLEGVGNAKAATDYADRVIIATHGDYNAFNAPRLMRTPLGRMATQFRKFQLIQITMYTKLISDAFKGASVQERQAARLALAYNVGHMAALGGAMGLPGFQLFSMVLGSVFGDDDEPDDAEATMRRVLGNGPLADLLTRGTPNMLGVDLSGKVGSGNMLSLFPYSDWDVTSRDGYMNLLAAAAGPFVGGLLPRMAEGVGNMSQGDYLKGLEKFLPGAIGNAIKGTRFAVEGVTTTKGDMVMSPDEVTWVDGLFQAAGLPTSTLTERNFRSSAEYKASKFFDEKSSEIKRSYVEAFQDNDTEAMAEARQDWLDMQATRRRLGMTVQPLSQLIKAPQERRKRERAAVGGVATDRETQGFVRQFTE